MKYTKVSAESASKKFSVIGQNCAYYTNTFSKFSSEPLRSIAHSSENTKTLCIKQIGFVKCLFFLDRIRELRESSKKCQRYWFVYFISQFHNSYVIYGITFTGNILLYQAKLAQEPAGSVFESDYLQAQSKSKPGPLFIL